MAQERNRLARDLHDSVTQSIFSMTLAAESARILLAQDPARVEPQLVRLQELAGEALTEMRSLIAHLRPTQVPEEDLAVAISKHLATLRIQKGLTVEFHSEGEDRLSGEQAEGLFRIVQEALNNVSKHAHTDSAVITLKMLDGKALLVVEDHGAGFDFARRLPSNGHMGLTSMRERVELQGGSFKVDSQPGMGTRIMVEVPYAKVV